MLYTRCMPITSSNTSVTEEGKKKDAFTVVFTNGAKEQLESLQAFTKSKDPLDVVRLGISLIQDIKEKEEKKREQSNVKQETSS